MLDAKKMKAARKVLRKIEAGKAGTVTCEEFFALDLSFESFLRFAQLNETGVQKFAEGIRKLLAS